MADKNIRLKLSNDNVFPSLGFRKYKQSTFTVYDNRQFVVDSITDGIVSGGIYLVSIVVSPYYLPNDNIGIGLDAIGGEVAYVCPMWGQRQVTKLVEATSNSMNILCRALGSAFGQVVLDTQYIRLA